MANELTVSFGMTFLKSGIGCSASKTKILDVSGTQYIQNVQAVGTSNEALVVGDVTIGQVVIVNLDSTNYVEIFSDNGNANLIGKIPAGSFIVTNVPGVTLYARANTAACEVQVTAIDV